MKKIMKKLLKFIYSNKLFAVLFIILQIVCIIFALIEFSKIYIIISLLSAILIIYEFNREEDPIFKLTWIFFIGVIPVFGVFLYIFTHVSHISYKIAKKMNLLEKNRGMYLIDNSNKEREGLHKTDAPSCSLADYIKRISGFPIYTHTKIKYFPIGEDKFEEMKKQLSRAKKFIFMEYFIIDADSEMWKEILNILKRKVREGVDVRVMYDDIGSLVYCPRDYSKTLEKFGIKCRAFSPVEPLLSTHQNNRDHRKILIADGNIAFIGGINIADEYINSYEKYGHWKDTAIMMKGEAAAGFTLMFIEMWNNYKHDIQDRHNNIIPKNYGKYMTAIPEYDTEGYILPIADIPITKERIGRQAYINMLYCAEKYVHITTPYLVIDGEMNEALKFAAKRGVDVKIIMPHIPDKFYVFWLSRSYYPELIDAGVKIYEYTPGFIHAKMSISDDKRAIIGSINHDFRSLYLHYECGAYIAGNSVVNDMEKDYDNTLYKCELITEDVYKKFSKTKKLFGKIIRILAPLL